jgi:hypothetical protein
MVPEIIVRRLARVRARERAVRLAWGAARWVAAAAGAVTLACLADWLIDLQTETPAALRAAMLAAQAALWVAAAAVLLARPLLRRESDRETALWVEARFPELGHRLITAVELNRPGARLEGMSEELIAAVTRQAEERAGALDFASKVDVSRVKKGLGLLAGVAAVAALLGATSPRTVSALLARQLLADRDIPRSVSLQSEAARKVHPTGEELVLRFRARGRVSWERAGGRVRIHPDARPAESYPLRLEAASGEEATFTATIPPSSTNFTYRARLRDGRTRKLAEVVYEPRPVVKKLEAWLLLPPYCGTRPDGSPYEQYRPRAEVAGPLGASAKVWIEAQKPLAKAALEILGKPVAEAGTEPVTRRLDLSLKAGDREAEGAFDLRPDETAYRVVLEDRNGFANTSPPRRGVAVVPDEPPRVALLPERFAMPGEALIADETEVEGMPVPLGGAVRIAYYAAHPYGLDRARVAYRLIKAGSTPPASAEGTAGKPAAPEGPEGNPTKRDDFAREGATGRPDVPWTYLPLKEVRATPEAGPFDLRLGLFRNSGFREPVEFHPVPSPDPERVPGRLEGGGCLDFQTRALPGVQVGDQIEFYIEVFARNPALEGQPGRSEVRSKVFVTQPQFVTWVIETLNQERRIRQLESRQRGVFTPEGTDR